MPRTTGHHESQPLELWRFFLLEEFDREAMD
jgi:hypothetical protein